MIRHPANISMHDFLSWLSGHTLFLSMLAIASVVMLTVTIVAAPWAVSRLPSNYLLHRLERHSNQSIWYNMISITRAILGLLVVLLGLIMLITPGPGVVMLLLGISIAEFPGKNRLLVYLATRPNVLASLNWMRRRHGKAPFVHPHGLD
jgi:hypothetical protein